jgi:membrane associated rhomboid family serine protease
MIDTTKTAEPQSDPRVEGLMLVGVMVAVMWAVQIYDAIDDYSLTKYGIEPRDIDGLDGVVFSPFLHGSWGHLIGNTVPFVVLGGMIALSGLKRLAVVTGLVMLVGGLGVWVTGSDNSVHIGASGVVFGYAGYLVARGIFTRNLMHLGLGVVVAAIWGTTLLSGLVPHDGISWQGHLFGAVGGVVAARMLSPTRQEKPKAAAEDPMAAFNL